MDLNESEKLTEIIPANEILSKIQAEQPVKYDHVIIVGDLNLSELDLPTRHKDVNYTSLGYYMGSRPTDIKVARSLIKITASRILGKVKFSSVALENAINFERTIFSGNAFFNGAQFRGEAAFGGAQFCGDGLFAGGTFASAEFNGNAYFNNTRSCGSISFQDANFKGYADFTGAKFKGADFAGTVFRDVSFYESKFSEVAYFRNAKFKGDNLGIAANFYGAQFDEDVDFTKSQLNGVAYFDEVQFKGSLIGWISIKNAFKGNEATYVTTINNLKNHGKFDDADDCYYQFRLWKQSQESWLEWCKYGDILAWLSCGYGVRAINTIYFGLFWLAIFGVVYFFMIRFDSKTNSMQQLGESFWFSTMVLLSVPSELFPEKADKYKEYARKIKYHLPILERLIGWGLLIVFITTLSRVMVRY